MARDHVTRDRLEQIFLHAEDPRGVAIEVDVVELADQQHVDVGLDDVRQRLQRGQRAALAGDVDDQDARRRSLAQQIDRAANIGAMELDPVRCGVAQPVAQHVLGFGIGDEGDDVLAVGAGRCLLRRDFRERNVGWHHWPPCDPPLATGTTLAMALSGSGRSLSFLMRSRAAAACCPSPLRAGDAAHQVGGRGHHRSQIGFIGVVRPPHAFPAIRIGRHRSPRAPRRAMQSS